MPFRFEGLAIWHTARDFAARIYKVTAKFPPHELYGFASQMNRASNAASLLIAEGAGLDTNALFNTHEWADELAPKINAFRHTRRYATGHMRYATSRSVHA